MDTLLLVLALVCLIAAVAPVGAGNASLVVWAPDPLEKVFQDAQPPAYPGAATLRAARGQTASGQLALLLRGPAARVSLAAQPLVGAEGRTIPAERVRWHFQGFIPLGHNTADGEVLRKAPCAVPDVLLPDREREVPAGSAQPVWVAVDVPEECPPGEYRGAIRVQAGAETVEQPVALQVYDFTLPRERHLWVTNWFNTGNIGTAHRLEPWSEPYWEMLGRYARAMAEHRQNVALASLSLVDITRTAGGKLEFDFTRLDRYVRLLIEAGAGERLELGHTAHFGEGGWSSKEIVLNSVSAKDAATGKSVTLAPEEGLGPLLRALEAHLRERGWLERSMIHVADEPAAHNLESWRKASEFIRRHAPGIRRIDAIETIGFEGALEVWVPKLNHLNVWYPHYRRAQQEGAEMWFYTCCHPTGAYPNRFLDYPLVLTRELHWLNYAYDLPGYLHWGLNFWGKEPFGAPSPNLPPGDTHVVYPGPEGPLSSLRWQAMREGIEDYEWLRLHAEGAARVRERLGKPAEGFDASEGAHALARLVVRSFTDCERSPARFHAARERLAREIEEMEKPPLLLVSTDPPGGSDLFPGPIAIRVQGVAEPGAQVKLNGEPVEVGADGRFLRQMGVSREGLVTVEASRDGHSKRVVREFRIRR